LPGRFARSSVIPCDMPRSLHFQGFRFTKKNKQSAATLRFKVLTDGLVYLACTSRFGTPKNGSGDWKSELISEKQLHEQGWHQLRAVELKTGANDYVWWVYSRTCKAGEAFSYRTEKFVAPILLVKE